MRRFEKALVKLTYSELEKVDDALCKATVALIKKRADEEQVAEFRDKIQMVRFYLDDYYYDRYTDYDDNDDE